ncbi:MAG TPA: alpha/beta hydrolase [Chitinophagaceae bacterium]
MANKKLYLISGLGADQTVFNRLHLADFEVVFLDWIEPLKNETLGSYALRLAEKIKEPDASILGLSMGGMIASEIVRMNPGMRAVIISSNRTRHEFPPFLRFLARYFPLYELSTKFTMRMVFPVSSWILGAESPEDRKHLRGVIDRTNLSFVKWCIRSIVRWNLETPQPRIIHIHGTNDRLLPYRLVNPDYTIEGGGHLMIRNRAEELSALIRQLLMG